MDLIRTLGVAIDPSAAKAGGKEASAAFKGVGEAAKGTEKATTGAQKQIDATGRSMGTAKRAGDLLRETLDRQNTILTRMDSSLRALTAALGRKKFAMDAATTSSNAMGKANRTAANETDRLNQTAKASTDNIRQATTATNNQTSALGRLALMAAAATSQLRLMQSAALVAMGSASLVPTATAATGGGRNIINVTGSAEAGPSAQLLLQSGAAAKTAAQNLQLLTYHGRGAAIMWNTMASGAARARGALSSIGSVIGSTAGQFGVMGGVAGAALFTKGMLDSGQAQDRLRNSLRASTGNMDIAMREIAFVRDMTSRLGLEFESTAASYSKFVSVGKLSKLTFAEIRDTFEGVADATAVMGLSSDEANGAMLALTQMLSKGRVTAEELNQQLAERIPGAVTLMAKSLGVGTAEMLKMMERGELIATDVLPKFGAELKKQFGPEATRNAVSTTGAINELKNAWVEFKQELIDAGAVEALKKFMAGIIFVVRNIGAIISHIRSAFADLKKDFGDGPLGTIAAAMGAIPKGLENFGLDKRNMWEPKKPGNFELPESETYMRMPAFKVAPSPMDNFRSGLRNSAEELSRMGTYQRYDSVTGQLEKHMGQLEKAGEETTQSLASNFSDFFGGMVTEGGSAISRLRTMFGSLAKDIATIFARRTIAEPIAGALSMALSGMFGFGGGGGAAPAYTPVDTNWSFPIHHAGGSVGGFSMSRMLPPSIFASAPRFHNGLAPDEFPAVLQRGERVVPKSQANNWGGGGGDINITVTVDGSQGGTHEENQRFGGEIARQIEAKIDQRILQARMPRGILHA